MFDHVSFTVRDVERSKAFYDQALAPLGIAIVMEDYGWVGYGRNGRPQFWFGAGEMPAGPFHIAFAVENRALVDAFHAASLAAGGIDNGPPGLREIYHPNYYGAFVLDPDGNNVEAVCHASA